MASLLLAVALINATVVVYLTVRLIRVKRMVAAQGPVRTLDEAIPPRMGALADAARGRHPRNRDAVNVLPPVTVDLDQACTRILPTADRRWQDNGERRDFDQHLENLRNRLAGRREIELHNAIAISYLRRKTRHADHAKALFFRIWDEKGPDLIDEMSTRWIISTLMTFADHGRTEAERTCGALGYAYGALIVSAETERCYWDDSTDPEISRTSPDHQRFGLNGSPAFELGTSNHLINLNAFVYDHALRTPVVGPILEKLMMRVRYSDTFFSRFDEARQRLALGTEAEVADRFWSFATPPGTGAPPQDAAVPGVSAVLPTDPSRGAGSATGPSSPHEAPPSSRTMQLRERRRAARQTARR